MQTDQRTKKILIVDDDPDIVYIFSMLLKLNDYDVYPYTDPEAALTAFPRRQFDLLLLDIKMPVMSGFDLYRKMKIIDENVKVCFMTNHSIEYLQQFRNLFPELADENFCTKPVSGDEILKMVETALASTK